MRFPPEYFPPPGAVDFFVFGENAGQIVADGAVVLGTVQLPRLSRGVIRDVEVGIGNMTAAADVRWRVLVDGAPAQGGWGSIRMAPRGAAFVSKSFLPESTVIRLPAGAQVQLVAEILAGGPCDMSASLHGWSWTER